MFRHLRSDVADFVDVYDTLRKRLIAEAEYQASCDAGSKVLRVSGKCRKPDGVPIKAVVRMERP